MNNMEELGEATFNPASEEIFDNELFNRPISGKLYMGCKISPPINAPSISEPDLYIDDFDEYKFKINIQSTSKALIRFIRGKQPRKLKKKLQKDRIKIFEQYMEHERLLDNDVYFCIHQTRIGLEYFRKQIGSTRTFRKFCRKNNIKIIIIK